MNQSLGLEEIGDMNSNVLEFLLGETDEKEDFDANTAEFREFFAGLREVEQGSKEKITVMDNIGALFAAHQKKIKL